MRRMIMIFLACALAAGAGLFGWKQMAPLDVTVASIEKNLEVRVFGLGTVEAQVISKIGFQVGGRLNQLGADQGDVVAAGAELARLDERTQTGRVTRAEVAIMQAGTALARAKAVAHKVEVALSQRRAVNQRRQSLVDRGAVSREAADEAQTNEETAQADVVVAQWDTEVAAGLRRDAEANALIEKVALEQHRLASPFAARIIQRHKELGSIVNPGEVVFTIVAPASIWVRAFVDEARAGDLALGQTAFVRLRSDPARRVEAEIVRIDQENDRVTEERRVYVRCRACQAEHQIRYLGEQAEVEIVKRILPEAIAVPAAAVAGFNGQTGSVFVLANGRLARRDATFSDVLLDGRLVLSTHLRPGESVVTSATPGLREGRAAKIVDSTP